MKHCSAPASPLPWFETAVVSYFLTSRSTYCQFHFAMTSRRSQVAQRKGRDALQTSAFQAKFNLVAELRLPILAALLTLVLGFVVSAFPIATSFPTMLATSTTRENDQMTDEVSQQMTMSTTVLATTTTTVPSLTVEPFETLSTTILAFSTTRGEINEVEMSRLITLALNRTRQNAKHAVVRFEELQQFLQLTMTPSELVNKLHSMSILSDNDLDEEDVHSLFEHTDKGISSNHEPIDRRFDSWWYDTEEEHEDKRESQHFASQAITAPSVLSHGTMTEDADRYGRLVQSDNHASSTHNETNIFRHWLNEFLQSRNVTLADPSQLNSIASARRLSGNMRAHSWALKHRLHLLMIMVGCSLVSTAVCGMNIGRPPFQPQRGPQPFTADIGTATLKTPPSWCYENAANYSLRSWISDVVLWASATDLEPERQGPAVALQVFGCARDLIREIPAPHLRDGLWEQGQHVPGLMLLCRQLASRYAPLDAELQTRAMAELMGFSRMNNESIDSCLTRFDVLRSRAIQQGGFAMSVTSLSWLLLNGLRLRPEQWDRLLLAHDGEFPNTDAGFQQLLDRIRRVGRMHEGFYHPPQQQGATGNVGTYFFPTFDNPHPMPGTGFGMNYDAYYGGGHSLPDSSMHPQSPIVPEQPSASGINSEPSFLASQITADEEQCVRCGMFYEDEFSSGTETDDGAPDDEAAQLYGYCDNDPNRLANVLHEAYLVAKQRWRRFTGRPPRKYRRGHFNKHRQQHNQRRLQRFGQTYAAFLPANAFAAHRGPGGKGGGKKGSSRTKSNPKGRDGQPLKCHRCASTEHLMRKCPKPDTGHYSQSGQPGALAMLTSSIPGLQFFTHGVTTNDGLNAASRRETAFISKVPNAISDELESLRSVSTSRKAESVEASEQRSQKSIEYDDHVPTRCPPPNEPAPTLQEIQGRESPADAWTSYRTGMSQPGDAASSSSSVISQSRVPNPSMQSTASLLSGLLHWYFQQPVGQET